MVRTSIRRRSMAVSSRAMRRQASRSGPRRDRFGEPWTAPPFDQLAAGGIQHSLRALPFAHQGKEGMITDPLDGPKLEPRLERDVRYRPLRDAHEPTRVEGAEGMTDRVDRSSSIVRV